MVNQFWLLFYSLVSHSCHNWCLRPFKPCTRKTWDLY